MQHTQCTYILPVLCSSLKKERKTGISLSHVKIWVALITGVRHSGCMWLHTGLCGHHKQVYIGSCLWEKIPLPHLGLEPAWVLCLAVESNVLLLPSDFRHGIVMAQNTLPSSTTCSFYQDKGLAGTAAPTFLGLQTFPVHLPTSGHENFKGSQDHVFPASSHQQFTHNSSWSSHQDFFFFLIFNLLPLDYTVMMTTMMMMNTFT